MEIFEVEQYLTQDTAGLKYQLNDSWTVYNEKLTVHKFSTIAGFWHLFALPLANKRLTVLRKNITVDNQSKNFVIVELHDECDQYDIFISLLMGLVGETIEENTRDISQFNGLTLINNNYSRKIILWLSEPINDLIDLNITNDYHDLLFGQSISSKINYMVYDRC